MMALIQIDQGSMVNTMGLKLARRAGVFHA